MAEVFPSHRRRPVAIPTRGVVVKSSLAFAFACVVAAQMYVVSTSLFAATNNGGCPPDHRGSPLIDRGSLVPYAHGNSAAPPALLLPDWRIVADCSAYSLDCFVHASRGRYREYPFRVDDDDGGSGGEDNGFEWKTLKQLPKEWERWFRDSGPGTARLGEDERSTSAVSVPDPPLVSERKAKACLKHAARQSFEEQLASTIAGLRPQGRRDGDGDGGAGMVSFTVAGEDYSRDMLHEVWEMARDVAEFPGSFFFVAVDRYTVERSCAFGYPVVAVPGAMSDLTSGFVRNPKLVASLALLEAGRDFFFFEMDVWFLRSPRPLLRRQRTDYVVSSQQLNPKGGHVGVFAAKANDSTRAYFRMCIDMLASSPKSEDFVVMNDVASLNEAALNGQKFRGSFSHWEKPVPPVPRAPLPHPMSRSFLDPHAVAVGRSPIPTESTVALRVLGGSPHGKKMMAKELGAWVGYRGPTGGSTAGGGYYARTGPRRRYILLDGRVLGGYSTVRREVYHSGMALQWTVAAMVALARRTNRIFVLPRVVADFYVHFLWTFLDLKSVEELGVEVRETNFPSNPKAWYDASTPFRTVARAALFRGGKLFVHLPGDGEVTRAWKLDYEHNRTDALFALANSEEEMKEAEALFINPAFIQKTGYWNLDRKGHWGSADYEIKSVYQRLRWCGEGIHHGARIAGNEAGRALSEDDCYGRGKAVE